MINTHLVKQIAKQLKKHNLTIATAESCTTGLLAHTLTTIPGSSSYFDRGVITYSNQSKQDILNIPSQLLETYGAVSKEVAKGMAQSIQKQSHVDIGIATTGIAGPHGGTKQKPVGLVYVGIATKKTTQIHKFQFNGNRQENQKNTCYHALTLLLDIINTW